MPENTYDYKTLACAVESFVAVITIERPEKLTALSTAVLDIISIRPNPSQDEIELDLHSAMNQDALIEIYDALGVKVFSDARNIIAGSSSIHLDTKSLSGGVYLVRVGGVSQSFVKLK